MKTDDSWLVERIKRLIRDNPALSLSYPAEDWAALLCLLYWERYHGLTWAKDLKRGRLLSPETILRTARRHGLTPYKYEHDVENTNDNYNLDNYLSGHD